MDTFGVQVIDCIGSCELTHVYISNRLGKVRPGSLGQLVPGYEAKIVDENGRELAEGEEGILWVKGESRGLGYWQAHHKTSETFKGEWVNTGDLFRRDQDGYYWFVGRGGDVLKVGGVFVAPLQIENCLLTHEAVKEAAVIGAEDDQGLIKPKAFIAVNEGFQGDETLASDLKNYIKQNLAPYKYPRWISFLPKLPKDNNGKIRKKELIEMDKQHEQTSI
jgi:benzoate-CoA ligase